MIHFEVENALIGLLIYLPEVGCELLVMVPCEDVIRFSWHMDMENQIVRSISMVILAQCFAIVSSIICKHC